MFFPLFLPIPIPIGGCGYTSRRCRSPAYYIYEPYDTRVLVGPLPNDFLRVASTVPQSQEEADRAAAIHLHNQELAQAQQLAQNVGRLQVTVISAVLNKNYGMTRMDPYLQMRIGHEIYETQTDFNGAKNPKWHKTFQIFNIQRGINSLHIEIFDERTLSEDEKIAWITIPIPETIWQGETVDEWYSLNGKLGEGLEGTLNLVMSYSVGPPPTMPPVMMGGPMYGYRNNYAPVPVYQLPPQSYPTGVQPHPAQTQIVITEEDLKQVSQMFPDVDKEVIKSVMEASRGNKETAINSLLQMQST